MGDHALVVGELLLEAIVPRAEVQRVEGGGVHPAHDVLEEQQTRRIALEGGIMRDDPGVDGALAAKVQMRRGQLIADVQREEDAAEVGVAAFEHVLQQSPGPARGEDVGLTRGAILSALPGHQLFQIGRRSRPAGEERRADFALHLPPALVEIFEDARPGGALLRLICFVAAGQPDHVGRGGAAHMRRECRLILEHVREVQPINAEGFEELPGVDLQAGLGDEALVVAHGRAGGHGRECGDPRGKEPLERAILVQNGDPNVIPVAVLSAINRPRPPRGQERAAEFGVGGLDLCPCRHVRGGQVLWSSKVDGQVQFPIALTDRSLNAGAVYLGLSRPDPLGICSASSGQRSGRKMISLFRLGQRYLVKDVGARREGSLRHSPAQNEMNPSADVPTHFCILRVNEYEWVILPVGCSLGG